MTEQEHRLGDETSGSESENADTLAPDTSPTFWWSIGSAVACTAAVAIAGVIYTNSTAESVTRESEQKWCGVVVTLDDAYSQLPPASPLGQRVADEMKRLRQDFRC